MKTPKILILFALILAFASAHAGYYDNVINLTGQELYLGLRALISTNTYSSYDGAKVYLFQTLDNVNGYVRCIYTGHNYNVGYSYTGSTNPNTEHTYAQSWFSSPQTSIKKADLHHLFPSNSVVNSSRGNYPLFTVANHASANVYYNDTPWQSYRGNSNNGYTVFEPADETKGNIARALLYFNTRYNDPLTQQNVFMTPDLVAWHYQDPPDAIEIARNQGIYTFQGNRNPYIDHPEFVGRIWGGSSNDDPSAPNASSIVFRSVYPNPFTDQ
ncbi:MAG: endonuclease, partial [Candidatus Cloacimonadaceae bacterium]|nr:endonuclease [Candidatus Cloacimonadaceae bacterium]